VDNTIKLAELLRSVATSIKDGKLDESVLSSLAKEGDALRISIKQLDEPSRVRFAAIGSLLDSAAARIEELESGTIPLSKTWGRQDVAVEPSQDIPLAKTWGRQDVAVEPSQDIPLAKTWGRQDVAVEPSQDIPLAKTWGRQDVAVEPSQDIPLAKTWGRQDVD
jgi:hypothetical protein